MKPWSDNMKKVMRVLNNAGARRLTDIAERTSLTQDHAYAALFKLARVGEAIHAVPNADGVLGETIYYFGKRGRSKWRQLRDREHHHSPNGGDDSHARVEERPHYS